MKYYFAYGSNMVMKSMKTMCRDAQLVGTGILQHHRLEYRFHLDIDENKNQKVHGLLWKITDECEENLDRYEGYPYYYTKKMVKITVPQKHNQKPGTYDSMVYVMVEKGPKMPPNYIYHDSVYRAIKKAKLNTKDIVEALKRSIAE